MSKQSMCGEREREGLPVTARAGDVDGGNQRFHKKGKIL